MNGSANWEEIEEQRKAQIVDEIATKLSKENPELFRGKMKLNEAIDTEGLYSLIGEHVNNHKDVLQYEREDIIKEIAGQATGYGALAEFWVGEGASDITEVSVNAEPDGRAPVFYGKHGLHHYAGDQYFKDGTEVHEFIRKHVDGTGRQFSSDSPIVDAWLPDGSRLAAMGFKVNPYEATICTIRKSPVTRPPMPLIKMVENGTIPQLAYDITVDTLVPGQANLGFFGGTDTGKTTIMRSAGQFINPWDRTIIGESSFEFYMPNLKNCINMLTVKIGSHEIVSMSDICDSINRNNPKRAIVSEARNGEIVAASEIAESTPGGFWISGHAPTLHKLKTRLPKMYARGGMPLPQNLVDAELKSMFKYLYFLDKDGAGKRTLMALIEVTEKDFTPIIVFDKHEFAISRKKRWIWNAPIDYEQMGDMVFRGAKNEGSERYIKIPGDGAKKYLYPGLGGEPCAN